MGKSKEIAELGAVFTQDGGNVGIGTTSPTDKLHIKSGGNAYRMLFLEAESGSGDSGILLQGDGGHQFSIQQPGGSQGLFFYDRTNAAFRMYIDNLGNVGIGTTSPDLVGSTTTLTLNHSGGNGQLSLMGNGTVYGRIFADNATGDLKMGNPTSNDVMFYTANTERMRIINNGYVSIGADNPTQKLTIGSDNSTSDVGYIRLRGYNQLESNIYKTASYGIHMDTDSNSQGIRIDGGKLVLGITGNVGIGTETPGEKLHIEGTNPKIRLLNNSTGQSGLEWWNDYGGVDHVNTSINWNEGSANWEFKSFRADAQSGYPYGNIQFYNGSSSSPTLKLNINTAGHVTMPYQPAFEAYGNGGSTSLSSGAVFPINTTRTNIGNHYNTSNYRFTAPVNGFYSFQYGLYAYVSGQTAIKINGSDFTPSDSMGLMTIDTNELGSVAISIYLNANDYVQVGWRNGFSGNVYLSHTYFTGFLVG